MRGSPRSPVAPPVLSTRRLVLTPLSPEDEAGLLTLFREPAVRQYLLDDTLVDAARVADEVAASNERFRSGSAGLWAIRGRGGGDQILGFVGFRPFFDPPELQLLYGLHPDSWSRGYATEAASAVLDYAFTVLGFHIVKAATDVPNVRSVGVMERLGMTRDRVTADSPAGTVFYRLGRPSAGASHGSRRPASPPAPSVQDEPSVQDGEAHAP